MIAAGTEHSLILTRSGLVYAFGSNSENQLGIPSKRSSETPICVQEINHIPMCFIAAGGFSAAIANENKSLYLWGTGTFGEFEYPHRVKKISGSVKFVSVGQDFGAAITTDNALYTWGDNPQGQLGTGDFVNSGTPRALENICKDGRSISHFGCGSAFMICLGQAATMSDGLF